MSKPLTASTTFVPAPIDGLDLISSPADMRPTVARQLDNYQVYDSGIRQVAYPAANLTAPAGTAIGSMFVYQTNANLARMIYTANNKFYRMDAPTDTSATDISAGSAITNVFWNPCFFNKNIFFFNGTNVPRTHDRGVGNVADFSPTGPTATTLIQGSGYKHRLYIVQKDSTTFWYGAVDAISGTWTSYDLGTVFETSGNLFCCFSWTYNQGLNAEELLCFINTQGELLIYSGDYPTSPNWTLAARAFVPKFSSVSSSRQPFVKTANDVLLVTTRGLVPLSSVVSGTLAQAPYFTASRNIKDLANLPTTPAFDLNNPFLYVGTSVSENYLYCLNYERGAWSKIFINMPAPASMCIFDGYLMIGGSFSPVIKNVNLGSTGYADANNTYTWKTPFFDFGKDYQKHSKFLRVLGTDRGSALSFKNTASISTDFIDPASATTDTKTTTISAVGVNAVQELAPPGTGTRLSYCFSRAGVANEKNEIQGAVVAFEYGGLL